MPTIFCYETIESWTMLGRIGEHYHLEILSPMGKESGCGLLDLGSIGLE